MDLVLILFKDYIWFHLSSYVNSRITGYRCAQNLVLIQQMSLCDVIILYVEYADDVCLVSHKYEHMQRKLDDLWKESKKAGLEINSSKTEEIRGLEL